MKFKQALKKFNFLKKLDVPDNTVIKLANILFMMLKGSKEQYLTPLATKYGYYECLAEWDEITKAESHRINEPLAKLEYQNREKFGPRSYMKPWPERLPDLRASYDHQDDSFIPHFHHRPGKNNLAPVSLNEAVAKSKLSSSAGLPFVSKKSKCVDLLLSDFDTFRHRKDPCLCFTRTAENSKTRNVWGYPFADTLFAMQFYMSFLKHERTLYYRAAVVSPEVTAERITKIIDKAIATGRLVYCVDFKGFDSSVKYQYIIKAFDYIKSCYYEPFHPFLDYICERMYSIGIVTPTGIYRGNHGVPSGDTFTNSVDSIVQSGIAFTLDFIREDECQVQGDDGLYILKFEDIKEFVNNFTKAGLKLETTKCNIANDHAIFCQNLYHVDYRCDNGLLGGIYPTYRALNRLLFQERFVNFNKMGIRARDYYAIRTLTILENCKHHPLFEEFVRFIIQREQNSLDVSEDSIIKYCNYLNLRDSTSTMLNHQYGSKVIGIRNFESFKLATKILAEN